MMRPFSCAVCALKALQNSMMLTPCWPSAGPTGGAGLAWPPGIWSLISVRTFFAMTSIQFLDLVERELDRDLPLEDVDQHLELLLVRVDVDDLAVEVGERAGRHLDGLAERVLDGRPRPLGGRDARVQDPVDLALRQRHRLGARADEAGHARRVLDDGPRARRSCPGSPAAAAATRPCAARPRTPPGSGSCAARARERPARPPVAPSRAAGAARGRSTHPPAPGACGARRGSVSPLPRLP